MLGNPHSFGTGPLRITKPSRAVALFVSAWPGSAAGNAARSPTRFPPLRRGRYAVGPTTVIASDPFGLVIADTRSRDTAELIVQPHRDELAPLALRWPGETARER